MMEGNDEEMHPKVFCQVLFSNYPAGIFQKPGFIHLEVSPLPCSSPGLTQ